MIMWNKIKELGWGVNHLGRNDSRNVQSTHNITMLSSMNYCANKEKHCTPTKHLAFK
jgi:hypothetical protein